MYKTIDSQDKEFEIKDDHLIQVNYGRYVTKEDVAKAIVGKMRKIKVYRVADDKVENVYNIGLNIGEHFQNELDAEDMTGHGMFSIGCQVFERVSFEKIREWALGIATKVSPDFLFWLKTLKQGILSTNELQRLARLQSPHRLYIKMALEKFSQKKKAAANK
jgi:hypothetical protein